MRGDAVGGTGADELLQELKKTQTEPEKVEQKEESKEQNKEESKEESGGTQ